MKKLLLLIFVVVLASACTTTRYVEVPVVHTDTLRENRIERDSVWLHDSIHVKEKGDTVWFEKWHVNYKEKIVHDTIYQSRTDSVAKPYPVYVEKEVAKKLTWWQKTQMYVGDGALLVVLAMMVYGLIKLYKETRIL